MAPIIGAAAYSSHKETQNMRIKLTMVVALLALALGACDGGESPETGTTTTTATGGGGTGGAPGGAGGTTTATATSTGGGSTTEPACDLNDPASCTYPEPLLGYSPGAAIGELFGPLPGREDGASASCFGPFAAELVIDRAVVGFDQPAPGSFAIDVWAQEGRDPGSYKLAPVERQLLGEEEGPGGLTNGVYAVDPPVVVPAGNVVCEGVALAAYLPWALELGACEEPARTWWLGRPVTAEGALSWAMLACPEDPSVGAYHYDWAYELRAQP